MKQFSILNLLLLITVVCLGLAWHFANRTVEEQAIEIEKLLVESGRFVANGSTKIRLRTVKTHGNRASRFRVFLPKQQEYDIVAGPVKFNNDGTIRFDRDNLKNAARFPFKNFHGAKEPLNSPFSGECELEIYFEKDGSSPKWEPKARTLVLGVKALSPEGLFVQNETATDLKRFKIPKELEAALLDQGPNFSPQVPRTAFFSPAEFSREYQYDPTKPLLLVMKNPYQVWKDKDGNDLIVFAEHTHLRERTVFVVAIVPSETEVIWSAHQWKHYEKLSWIQMIVECRLLDFDDDSA